MKKTSKKLLAFLLSFTLILTTVSVGFFGVTASAATSSTVTKTDDAIIAVPETVYMTPSTGASTTGKYYVNNTINSARNGIDPEVSNSNTNGKVQLYIPGAKSFTVQVNTITSGIGDIVLANAGATSGSYENSVFNVTDASGYYNADDIEA